MGAGFANRAEAVDTVLHPDASGRIRIDNQIYVGPMDSLSIPAGTKVTIGANGSIFAQGIVNIGLNGFHSGLAENNADILRGVTMTYEGDGGRFPISGRNAAIMVFNVNFSGPSFASAFQGSSLVIASSTFLSSISSNLISVYQNAYLSLDSSIVKNKPILESENPVLALFGPPPIRIYQGSNATVTATRIDVPRSNYAIQIYDQSNLQIDDSILSHCMVGILAYNQARVAGMGNSISCATSEYQAYNDSTVKLTPRILRQCCSQVIFIPGIKGSRLYKHGFGLLRQNQLWEPNVREDVKKLFLDHDGRSILSGIYTRDIIEKTNIAGSLFSTSIYGGFIAYLKKLKTDKAIAGYSVFPYDWRYATEGAGVVNLVTKIEEAASESSNGQVVLIAHSYGGFLAKEALRVLDGLGKKDLVRSITYAAVPETGAPQAIFAALHGDEQAILASWILDPDTSIDFAANMPSAHLLTPSEYFAGPLSLDFKDKKTGSTSSYITGIASATGYSLPGMYGWLRNSMKSADNRAGQSKDSPSIDRMHPAPSLAVALKAQSEKDFIYSASSHLEDRFRSYSIIGVGIPTPAGMTYEYVPCIPFPKKILAESKPCSNLSGLTRRTAYSVKGDGTVIFDGKDRRSGRDILLSLAEYNKSNKQSISHVNFMESKDVQRVIGEIIAATSTALVSDEENASGSGIPILNPDNPWLNTEKVHSVAIKGFVEGLIEVHASSASSTSFNIVTVDQKNNIQKIEGDPQALAITNVTHSSDGWSFGSLGTYDDVSLRSLSDQNISIEFSDQNIDSENGHVVSTEHFDNVPIGYGSVAAIDMQYVTPVPSRILILDIDADGTGDMVIAAQTDGSASSSQSAIPPHIPTFDEKKIRALESMNAAKAAISQLEIYSLRQMNDAAIAQAERYVRNGNPTMALLVIIKKQNWLAGLSRQYATRLDRLQNGLATRILSGFRTEKERQKKLAEIAKIQAFLRDLARLKIILDRVQGEAVDLLA